MTKFPAPPLPKATKEDWGRISPYFTLIGFILGLILYFSTKLLDHFQVPVLFSSALILLIWNLITGCLHLDGLMDTFDGINCQDPDRKLEAMKDSRIGAFGAIAGIFVILLKLTALCTIVLNKMFFVILFSLPLARFMSVYSFTFLTKNKDSGVSSSLLLAGVKKPQDLATNLFVLLAVFILCFFKLHLSISYLFFILLCFFLCLFWTHWLERHFKGHTGDTFGALIELSETTVLAVAVIFKHYLA